MTRSRNKQSGWAMRRWLLLVVGVLAILAATPLALKTLGLTDVVSIPGIQNARSLLAMLTDRSPGQRTEGQLTKTKKAAVPRQRALGKVTTPKVPDEFVSALIAPVPEVFEIAPASKLADLILAPTPVGGFIVPSTTGGGGGGGGGGGDDTPEPPEQEPPEVPVPAVPEPGTWVMMLLGFGATGLMIRRRRRTPEPELA